VAPSLVLAEWSQSVKLLDLFCGAGGAAMGYARAGFEVVGVDIEPQPHYPFAFIQADASAPPIRLEDFDLIHASPPCQFYASLAKGNGHWRSIPPTRALLKQAGRPYVIENIADAKWDMRSPVQLCGSNFGLGVRRHRMFETSFPMMVPPCTPQTEIRAYYGKKGWLVWTPGGAQVQKAGRKPILRGSVDQAPDDMGIDWMTWDELREAIPPAYTQFIGEQLMEQLTAQRNVP
jgi:DNA (cytosine-5)-methyltransferase 1